MVGDDEGEDLEVAAVDDAGGSFPKHYLWVDPVGSWEECIILADITEGETWIHAKEPMLNPEIQLLLFKNTR